MEIGSEKGYYCVALTGEEKLRKSASMLPHRQLNSRAKAGVDKLVNCSSIKLVVQSSFLNSTEWSKDTALHDKEMELPGFLYIKLQAPLVQPARQNRAEVK